MVVRHCGMQKLGSIYIYMFKVEVFYINSKENQCDHVTCNSSGSRNPGVSTLHTVFLTPGGDR